jgi:hypothetical protein
MQLIEQLMNPQMEKGKKFNHGKIDGPLAPEQSN